MVNIHIVKSDGTKELFEAQKLHDSLTRAGADSSLSKNIIQHIENELQDGMSTEEIYRRAFFLLKKRNRRIAVKYSLRTAVMDLGPSGFPFEKFVAEIFKSRGFETKTGEIVMGGCVAHEVDVVAWNENKLIMVEAKFHNQIGFKSDLKVALYIKARYEDLKEAKHMYGFARPLDEMWLVTNTKFTQTAIHYAECKGLKLVGWNHPVKGNLQDLIDDGGVHPITCLSTLTKVQRKALLEQDVILCRQLIDRTDILKSFGFSDEKINKVLEEIALLNQ
ncbi:MAG: hypothetical protein RJA61_656 [Candidatus Parcubacteria bacterium]|jgi:hypothetical protein